MAKTNPNIDIKTSDIKAILEDVQKSLSLQAAEKLVKAAEESSPADASPPSEAPESAPPAAPEESESAAPPPDTSAVDEGSAPPMDVGSAGQDPAADQAMSPEQLSAEYAALPDDVLQAHYMACKQALLSRSAPAQSAPAPAQSAAPMASPGAPAGAPPMMGKGEVDAGKEMPVPKESAKQPVQPEVAMKSEMEALRNQNAELAKGLDTMAGVLTKFIGKPVRKAITNTNYVERVIGETKEAPKTLSKKEVQEAVRGQLGSMSTKDRSKLLDFYENKLSFDKIAHLVKD